MPRFYTATRDRAFHDLERSWHPERVPRQYSMGGRPIPGAGAGHASGGPPPPVRSLRERFGALKNLPPFLKLVWKTSPGMTIADLLCRLARAFLPVATL